MQSNTITHYLIGHMDEAAALLKKVVRKKKSDDVHEFRVALRRVRSLVKLCLETSVPFPEDLKSAVKATNPIRELDVLIESIKQNKYPKTAKHLARMRWTHADACLNAGFQRSTLRSLQHYCATLRNADPDLLPEELIRIVEESYRSCRKGYNALDDNTPQKELHRLRVEFKNTRYGLEFLNAAGLRDEHEKINECKSFQNSLGAVQDAYNQVSWLKKLYKKYPCTETKKLLKKRKKMVKRLKAASRSAQFSVI